MNKEKEIFTSPILFVVIATFCNLLWGSAFPCINIGYKLFQIGGSDTATQILFAGIRFALAGILVIIIGSFLQKKVLMLTKETIKYVGLLSLVQTILQYVFFYIALAHMASVNASILEGSNVFLTILIACYIFKSEKMTVFKAIGCILGFLGVVLVNLNGSSIQFAFTFLGEGLLILSATSSAFSSSLIKICSKHENAVTLSGYQFLFGGIVMALSGFIFGGRLKFENASQILLMLYLAFISACAYTLWGLLLKHNPVAKVSIFMALNPIFGVILSMILLNSKDEKVGPFGLVSLILVILGIFIVNNLQDILEKRKENKD